jgi:hypothetical protein
VRRRLAVWLIGSALLASVTFLVGCAVSSTVVPLVQAKHVAFAPGTACNAPGCHTQYKHQEPYLGPCDLCHNLTDWKQVHYTHKDPTFDNGMHPLVGCSTCHTEGQPLPSGACATCHDAPHGGWTDCTKCHTTAAWGLRKPLPVGHVSLLGGHAKLVCQDCHKNPTEPATPRTCTNCHGTNHGGLTDCQNCHDPSLGWGKPKPNFNHNEFFVRVGVHATLPCSACHPDNRFAGTPRICVGCHGVHHGGLTDCAACHSNARSSFTPAVFFNHNDYFVRTGRHATLPCSDCHPHNLYAHVIGGGSHQCVSCHGPQHGGLTNCAACHTTRGFQFTSFNHNSVFPLTGQHAVLAAQHKCSTCHPGGITFAKTITANCTSCHLAQTPHEAQFSNCGECHTPAGVDVVTSFPGHPIPLAGHHASSPCADCHTNLHFTTFKACDSSGCHGAGGVVFPDQHIGPSGVDCITCHYPEASFTSNHFAHPAILNFAGTAPSPHNMFSFGIYPAGCAVCHPSSSSVPDLNGHQCASCHPGE